jgi:hypothetical protein
MLDVHKILCPYICFIWENQYHALMMWKDFFFYTIQGGFHLPVLCDMTMNFFFFFCFVNTQYVDFQIVFDTTFNEKFIVI